MYQNINKIYHAAIYVRLSKEDGDISSSAKLESNSISNQKALILDFLLYSEKYLSVPEAIYFCLLLSSVDQSFH